MTNQVKRVMLLAGLPVVAITTLWLWVLPPDLTFQSIQRVLGVGSLVAGGLLGMWAVPALRRQPISAQSGAVRAVGSLAWLLLGGVLLLGPLQSSLWSRWTTPLLVVAIGAALIGGRARPSGANGSPLGTAQGGT
jgi:hypothetical protein